MQVTFTDAIGATLGLVALLGVVYAAVVTGNVTALGALISLLAAAAGFFLRAKVQPPTVDPTPTKPPIVPPLVP